MTTAPGYDWLSGWEKRLEAARGKSRWGGGEQTAPGVSTMPFSVLPDDVVEFLLDLDRHRLMQHDYRKHVERLQPVIADPDLIEGLAAEDCLYLLTYHIRTDRFVEGHLAEVLDRGDVTAILRRLAVIRLAEREPA